MTSRRRQQVVLAAGSVAVAIAGWWTSGVLVRRAQASQLPVLPDLTMVPAAVADELRTFDRAARQSPSSAEAIGALGVAYQASLYPVEARAAYERAASLAPAGWRWLYSIALLDEERGQTEEVVTRLTHVVRLEPRAALAWFRLGDAELKRANDAAASAAFDRARSQPLPAATESLPHAVTAPLGAYATYGLARVALRRGDAAEARRLLESIAGERLGVAARLLGQVLEEAGDQAAASAQFARADALGAYVPPADPIVDAVVRQSRHPSLLLKHAALAARAGDRPWREYLLRRAYEFHPDHPDVVFEMGTLMQAKGALDEALSYFEKHRRLAPGEIQTANQIGKCLADLGRYREAEDVLAPIAAGGDAVAEYNLGYVFDRQGQWPLAREHYERAVAINPFHARALNNLGVGLATRGDVTAALPYYQRALAAAPGDADVQSNLGAALLERGRTAEALVAFERALAIDPGSADAHNNAGVCLARLGRLDAARAQFEQALKLRPGHEGAARNLAQVSGGS